MRRRNRARLAGALAIASLLGGCSFAVSGPPVGWETRMDRAPDCTTSRAAPVADTVGALAFGIPAAALLIGKCGPGDHGQETDQTCEGVTNALGAVLLVPAAIYGIAAAVGYGKTGRCRDAVRAYRERRPHAARMWSSLPSSGRR